MSPIDDLTYDVITVLHAKAKALAAYEKYVSDAEADDDDELRELFASMRRQDEESVQQLKEVLAARLAEDLGYEDEEDDDFGSEEDDDEDEVDAIEDAEVEDPADVGADQIDAVHGSSEAASRERRGQSSPRHR
jgi:hypothetical protein